MRFLQSVFLLFFCFILLPMKDEFSKYEKREIGKQLQSKLFNENEFDLLSDELMLPIISHAFDEPTELQKTYDILALVNKRFYRLANDASIFKKRKKFFEQLMEREEGKNAALVLVPRLYVAIKYNFLKIFKIEYDEICQGFSVLVHQVAKIGHADIIDYLCSANSEFVEIKSRFSFRTPLHSAAKYGNISTVDVLLKHKACTNVKDENGETPLDLAKKNHHIEIVQKIVTNGANAL